MHAHAHHSLHVCFHTRRIHRPAGCTGDVRVMSCTTILFRSRDNDKKRHQHRSSLLQDSYDLDDDEAFSVVTMDGERSYNHTGLDYCQDDMQVNVGWLGPPSPFPAYSSFCAFAHCHVAPSFFSLSPSLALPAPSETQLLLPASSAQFLLRAPSPQPLLPACPRRLRLGSPP